MECTIVKMGSFLIDSYLIVAIGDYKHQFEISSENAGFSVCWNCETEEKENIVLINTGILVKDVSDFMSAYDEWVSDETWTNHKKALREGCLIIKKFFEEVNKEKSNIHYLKGVR